MLKNNLNFINVSPNPMMYTLMMFTVVNSMNNFMWKMKYFNYLYLFSLTTIFFYIILVNMNKLSMENFFKGNFSMKKKNILVNGFMMFLLSEMMIFLSLFWAYIHNAFIPNMYMGNFWPPKGINPSNPTSMIIFGTSMLMSSSMIIVQSHQKMMKKNFFTESKNFMILCILMGMIFIDMQMLEMSNYFLKLNFNFNDSNFSNNFLATTSLHAFHVLIGLIGLIKSNNFLNKMTNNKIINLNLEMSIWYWHFVDYIWILVFTMFYYLNF